MRFVKAVFSFVLIFSIALLAVCGSMTFAASGGGAEGIIKGVVKENNPSLGYITLYFEDGSGTDPDSFTKLVSLRSFTYGYEVSALRDGTETDAESIQPGDQVFIELDSDGYIQKISARSFYKPVYGTIHAKYAGGIALKTENGSFIYYPVSSAVPIYKNGKPGKLSDLTAGEKVKVLVQTDGESIHIAAIELVKTSSAISGIFRGNIEFYDPMKDSLVLSNVQEFVNGRWVNSSFIGIQRFVYSSTYKKRPSGRISGKAYFVTKAEADGTQRIITASYKSDSLYETVINDTLMSVADGGWLELENTSDIVKFSSDVIAVKDGKLVDISALNTLDPVKISAESSAGKYYANVLVCDNISNGGQVIYRGRIKEVDPLKSVTLESFVMLSGVSWEFVNTPKTFDIDISSSRLVLDDGIGNMRSFGKDYEGQTVYIAAEGTRINLISTAPYAESPVTGRIDSLVGGTRDSFGRTLSDPTGVRLTEVMVYNISTHQWSQGNDMEIDIPVNAIVLKNGQVGSTSLLKPGDEIKVIRHSQNNNGILIICD